MKEESVVFYRCVDRCWKLPKLVRLVSWPPRSRPLRRLLGVGDLGGELGEPSVMGPWRPTIGGLPAGRSVSTNPGGGPWAFFRPSTLGLSLSFSKDCRACRLFTFAVPIPMFSSPFKQQLNIAPIVCSANIKNCERLEMKKRCKK